MRTSQSQGRINHLELLSSLRPFYCHKPELSNIISKQVVHNLLALISAEKILSGIDIKGIVSIYILKIMGVFLFDPQFDEFILESLFVYIEVAVNLNSKKNTNPLILGWIINWILGNF